MPLYPKVELLESVFFRRLSVTPRYTFWGFGCPARPTATQTSKSISAVTEDTWYSESFRSKPEFKFVKGRWPPVAGPGRPGAGQLSDITIHGTSQPGLAGPRQPLQVARVPGLAAAESLSYRTAGVRAAVTAAKTGPLAARRRA